MVKTHEFSMCTDTATLAVFDPVCLQHRLSDSCDWWSVPWDEVEEINHGNMFCIDLGSDGNYRVAVHLFDCPPGIQTLSSQIQCKSGRIFFGSGEQLPGGGLNPDLALGGFSLKAASGTYRVHIVRKEDWAIEIWLEEADTDARNHWQQSPQLKIN